MKIFNRDPNNYKILSNVNLIELKKKYADVWKDDTFPEKQWKRVEKQLEHINDIPEFRAIIDIVKATNLKSPSILEIGCSSGYLSKILQKVHYEGTDYSSAFINFAKQKFPKNKFTVNDATDLKYKDKEFDIVISGCCILHIIDYPEAISEAARVSKKFVIFHRTPVLHTTPTTFLTKTAYGQTMMDIFFNEEELIDLFHKNNLVVVKIKTLSQGKVSVLEEKMTMKNYLCQKIT